MLCSLSGFSQDAVIQGIIADSIDKSPLPYVSIMLFNAKNHQMVVGTITRQNGSFEFKNLNTGSFYLFVSTIGYAEKRTKNIKVTSSSEVQLLETLYLKPTTEQLETVEITGYLPNVEYQLDKKVINVDKQLASQAGNAVDILENASSVQVDINGNVLLRGSAGITVLVDGVPTLQNPSETLQQIPAKSIDKIEIITNPSSKQESEGTAGIINIIRKKDKLEGTSGYLNLIAGNYERYGGDLMFKFKNKNVDFYFGADYNEQNFEGNKTSERLTKDQDVYYTFNQESEFKNSSQVGNLRTGMDINFTPQDVFGFEFKITDYKAQQNAHSTVLQRNSSDTVLQSNFNSENKDETSFDYTLKAFYLRNFKKPDHQLKAIFNYEKWNYNNQRINELKNADDEILDGKINREKAPADLFLIKLDYSLPVATNFLFEAGLQSKLQLYHDETGLQNYDTINDIYYEDSLFNQITDYVRNIHSFYGMFKSENKPFEYQFGLRGEFTDRKIENSFAENPYTFNRFNLFPSIHLAYKLKQDQRVFVSFSRRINRPSSTKLEPFLTYESAFNISRGNPELIPEYYNSLEMGYLKKFDDNTLTLEAYYRQGTNIIEDISEVYSESVFLYTYQNVGRNYALGFEFNLGWQLAKWWHLDLLTDILNYKVDGSYSDIDFSNQNISWNIRLNQSFKPFKKTMVQLNGTYNGPVVYAQGKSEGNYYWNLSLRQTLWKDRLSAVADFRDTFGTRVIEYRGSGPQFETHVRRQLKAPRISISVTYRFDRSKKQN